MAVKAAVYHARTNPMKTAAIGGNIVTHEVQNGIAEVEFSNGNLSWTHDAETDTYRPVIIFDGEVSSISGIFPGRVRQVEYDDKKKYPFQAIYDFPEDDTGRKQIASLVEKGLCDKDTGGLRLPMSFLTEKFYLNMMYQTKEIRDSHDQTVFLQVDPIMEDNNLHFDYKQYELTQYFEHVPVMEDVLEGEASREYKEAQQFLEADKEAERREKENEDKTAPYQRTMTQEEIALQRASERIEGRVDAYESELSEKRETARDRIEAAEREKLEAELARQQEEENKKREKEEAERREREAARQREETSDTNGVAIFASKEELSEEQKAFLRRMQGEAAEDTADKKPDAAGRQPVQLQKQEDTSAKTPSLQDVIANTHLPLPQTDTGMTASDDFDDDFV